MSTIVPGKPKRPIIVENGGRIPSGGTIGQALVKSSGLDYQVEWGTATASAAWGAISGTLSSQTDLQAALDAKQATLVSGTTIRTVNGTSLLGSGDVTVSGAVSDGDKGDITVSGSGATWTIDAGAVSLSKMADLASSTILGRATAGTGSPEALTAAQVRTILNVANGATANAADAFLLARANHTGTQTAATISDFNEAAQDAVGAMVDASLTYVDATPLLQRAALTGAITAAAGSNATALGSFTLAQLNAAVSDADVASGGGTATGTNTGDQTITLTGPVTGSGTGSFATTITANAVANTQLADMAANTIKANATAATADPADLAVGTNTVVGRVAGNIVAAQVVTAQIAANAADNTILADMATARIKGRVTAGTGDPEDLTGTQATTLLDTFTTSLKGLAPASGGGTTNFLRADGTWAAPPGGGGGSPGGASGEIQFNNAGAFGGAADVEIEGGQLRLPSIASPAVPASGGVKVFAQDFAGTPWPTFRHPLGQENHMLQPMLQNGNYKLFIPGGGTTVTSLGVVSTGTGTATASNVTNGTRRQRMKRIDYRVTTASTTAVAGWYDNSSQLTVGGGNSWEGGFWGVMNGGPATGVATATHRFFMGLRDVGAPADTDPGTFLRCVGIGYARGTDTNLQFLHNDGAGAATKIDLGASFAVPTTDQSVIWRLRMYSPPGPTQSVTYEVTNIDTGAQATGTVTTNLPSTTDFITPRIQASVGGTSSVIGAAVGPIMFHTED